MKILKIIIISLVTLLCIAAGLAKVLQSEQEVAYLKRFGLSTALIVAFGKVQLGSGILLIFPKTRLFGAVLAITAFVTSTIMILVGGNLVFSLLSTIPITLVCVIVYLEHAKTGQAQI